MSLADVPLHRRPGVLAAIADANSRLPADLQIPVPKVNLVTPAAFEPKKSWSTRYAEALAKAGWQLNVSQPDFLRLQNTKQQKSMNVAAIEFEFADYLSSQNYHPSEDVFEGLRAKVMADVLRQLPRVGGGLLQ